MGCRPWQPVAALPSSYSFKVGLWLCGVRVCPTLVPWEARTYRQQGPATVFRSLQNLPKDSLQVEANEPSLTLRREQLSLQYAIKLQANPRNPAYAAVFEPKYEALFGVKPSCIPPFGIRIASALRSVNPHNIPISKITVPPVAPWTLAKPRVLLDLHHATAKGSTTPEIYLSKSVKL